MFLMIAERYKKSSILQKMDKTLCGATAMLLIGGATQSSATKYRKWIVLPCPRREAELIGEVAQRDGGANPFPAAPYFPY